MRAKKRMTLTLFKKVDEDDIVTEQETDNRKQMLDRKKRNRKRPNSVLLYGLACLGHGRDGSLGEVTKNPGSSISMLGSIIHE
jgi:hypothetical protein